MGCLGNVHVAKVYQPNHNLTYVISTTCDKTNNKTIKIEISEKDVAALNNDLILEKE